MLEAIFPPGKREVSVFGLTQWDKGQKLCVSFENMPDSFQIHFSVRGSDEATVVEVRKQGTQAIADIPDELLTNEGDISAWIYLTGADTGETVGRAILYVRPRPRPKGYIEDLVPSQQKIVENMITELKNDLEYVKENGVNAEYVPEYVRKEALRVAKNVLSHQNENTLSFVIASDTHYDGEDYYFSKSYHLHIVDRVGGGDSFGGGLIYALSQGYNDQDAINFAVAASCLKHTIEHDFNQVKVDEVLALMKGSGSGRVER